MKPSVGTFTIAFLKVSCSASSEGNQSVWSHSRFVMTSIFGASSSRWSRYSQASTTIIRVSMQIVAAEIFTIEPMTAVGDAPPSARIFASIPVVVVFRAFPRPHGLLPFRHVAHIQNRRAALCQALLRERAPDSLPVRRRYIRPYLHHPVHCRLLPIVTVIPSFCRSSVTGLAPLSDPVTSTP